MSEQHYIALSINPWGISGCLATRDGKGSVEIQKTARQNWHNSSAYDLTDEAEVLQTFLRDLRGSLSGHVYGLVAIHPSWALVRRLPMPGGNERNQQQYLALQVERQKNILRDASLLWDNMPMARRQGTESPETLLVMCRTETLKPIEEAFTRCSIRPLCATISPLADLAWARGRNQLPDVADCVLLKAEQNGANILEITDNVVSHFGWMPYGTGNNGSAMAQLTLFSAKLEQRMSKSGIAHLAVCGAPRERAPLVRHINFLPNMQEIDSRDLPTGISFRQGMEKAEEDNASIEVLGLLSEQIHPAPASINLLQQNADDLPLWAERFSFLFRTRTAIPIAVALAVLLVLSFLKGGNLENSMYEESLKHAEEITNRVAAARFNKSILTQYQKEKVSTLEVMMAITDLLPSGRLLTRLGIDKNGAVMITGTCASHAQAEEITMNLNRSAKFSNAITDRTTLVKEGQVNYSIRCQLTKWPGKKVARSNP